MKYKVETLPYFKKRAKKLIKKFPSLRNELKELGNVLSTNPTFGTRITEDVYKIRLAIKSKGKGKSGGDKSSKRYNSKVIHEEISVTYMIAKNQIIVNFIDEADIKDLQIFSTNGKEIGTTEFSYNNNQAGSRSVFIGLHEKLAPGIYTAYIRTQSAVITKRFLN